MSAAAEANMGRRLASDFWLIHLINKISGEYLSIRRLFIRNDYRCIDILLGLPALFSL